MQLKSLLTVSSDNALNQTALANSAFPALTQGKTLAAGSMFWNSLLKT
ncbi:immunoglobulin heavy chain [Roseibium sp. TrichSKD4]|nr:immunoglobulin heavy chain [Roseibium sp. TrichSKD4]